MAQGNNLHRGEGGVTSTGENPIFREIKEELFK